jgi:hypothetical protein
MANLTYATNTCPLCHGRQNWSSPWRSLTGDEVQCCECRTKLVLKTAALEVRQLVVIASVVASLLATTLGLLTDSWGVAGLCFVVIEIAFNSWLYRTKFVWIVQEH